jgi:hypothetical protein
MTTRAQVQSALSVAKRVAETGIVDLGSIQETVRVIAEAAESARYKSITGKPVTDPVYESPSDVLEGA